MKKNSNKKIIQNCNRSYVTGFTLIEILIYIAIFALSATFLVAILGVVGKVQNRQTSANEVNQQISSINNTIQRLVKESSLVENDAGVSSPTLTLRMPEGTRLGNDPTKIFLENNVIYLQQGPQTASKIPLTNSNVKVENFSVIKYQNTGGPAVVQVDLSISYNSANPQSQILRTARTAITRISAATFDSSVLPNGTNLTLGQSATPTWERIYLNRGGQNTPAYTFANDTNLGIYSPDVDILGFVTGGSEKMRIDNSGKVKITGEVEITGINNGARKIVCIKSDNTLGTCGGVYTLGSCGSCD